MCVLAICLIFKSPVSREIYWINAAGGFYEPDKRKHPEILKIQCASAVLFAYSALTNTCQKCCDRCSDIVTEKNQEFAPARPMILVLHQLWLKRKILEHCDCSTRLCTTKSFNAPTATPRIRCLPLCPISSCSEIGLDANGFITAPSSQFKEQ